MMSDIEFDERLKKIDEDYSRHREGAEAARDQEVSRLFIECGWTQQKIAGRMGRTHQWVSNRLKFGAFLRFATSGCNSSSPPETLSGHLTERRFRDHWKRAGKGDPKETEAERFARVLDLLRENTNMIPKNYGNLVKKPGIKKAVIEVISGGKLLDAKKITEAVVELLPGIEVEKAQVSAALQSIQKNPPQGMAFDARHNGNHHKYRLTQSKRPSRNGHVPVVDQEQAGAMAVDALPLIDECINILKSPIVGRQTTLALDHLWKVRQMINHLLVPEEVA